MKKFIGVILAVVICIGSFYFWEQYQMQQFSDAISEMNLVDSRDFTKVTVSKVPSLDSSYTSYDINEVNELYRMLEKTPLEKKRKINETSSYYIIKFADHSLMQSVTYTIYDNDFVKREQDATSVYTSSYFKLQEPIDRTLLEEWALKK